jgi:NAD(P)-dependent dehydrogenase (short-subunit alcohol dehydrogenase family)
MTKSVFITGANTGIGFQIVRALYSSSKQSYTILVGSRSLSNAHNAIEAVKSEFPSSSSSLTPIQIDIEDDTSIQAAYSAIESQLGGKLDVLINNAGAQFESALAQGKITSERELWDKSWSVNTTSTQVVTSKFTSLLVQSSDPRLLFITSGTATLAGSDNTALRVNQSPAVKGWPKTGFMGLPAYRSAKTGLNMLMREWHRILKEDGVKVFAISPGLLATGLGGDTEMLKRLGAADPSVAGPFIRSVVEGERDGDVGMVLTRDGIQAW